MGTKQFPKSLGDLEEFVQREMDAYVYEVPEGSNGHAWSAEEVATRLQAMRRAIVSPYWADVEIRDSFEDIQEITPVFRRCAVIADNGSGTALLWDPVLRDFLLAEYKDIGFTSIGVRGDVVGCFLSI